MTNIIGFLNFRIGGTVQRAKGNWTINLGADKRDAVVGADGVHGAKSVPQIPFVEGELTDHADFSLQELIDTEQEDVILELLNGKKYIWPDAWFAGDGNMQTEEGNITVRFESEDAEEMRG